MLIAVESKLNEVLKRLNKSKSNNKKNAYDADPLNERNLLEQNTNQQKKETSLDRIIIFHSKWFCEDVKHFMMQESSMMITTLICIYQ